MFTLAHSGGTDSNGGHYDRSTGEYHYHHGYPAHQHINGVCPYEDDVSDSQEDPLPVEIAQPPATIPSDSFSFMLSEPNEYRNAVDETSGGIAETTSSSEDPVSDIRETKSVFGMSFGFLLVALIFLFLCFIFYVHRLLNKASSAHEAEMEKIRTDSFNSGEAFGREMQFKEDAKKISDAYSRGYNAAGYDCMAKTRQAYLDGYSKGKTEGLKGANRSKAYSAGYEDGYNDALLNNDFGKSKK